jgi:ArsR family transcriptional regulator, arsenate/arsenite/antimonite-responsive transcriptional repressor
MVCAIAMENNLNNQLPPISLCDVFHKMDSDSRHKWNSIRLLLAIAKLHNLKDGKLECNAFIECHHRQMTSFLDYTFFWHIIQCMLNYYSEKLPASPVNLEILAERLKVLGEHKRLLIFNLLMEGVQCNCELGDTLQISPNLISHHLSKLRAVGLVDMERDAVDARWVYYTVNRAALDELNAAFGALFDPKRIQPRRPNCGPHYLSKLDNS